MLVAGGAPSMPRPYCGAVASSSPGRRQKIDDQPGRAENGANAISPINLTTGQPEVYVERFPDLGDRRQISTGGGTVPVWSPGGTELFYRRPGDGAMMVVRATTEPSFTPEPPEVMFEGQYGRSYDVAPDGRRFLMAKRPEDETSASSQIILVQNWTQELLERVPVN